VKKILISGALAVFAVTSAFAQTTTVSSEYYVVRDATTKKCTVVDKKPTTILQRDHWSARGLCAGPS
jgi:hypothetical protein